MNNKLLRLIETYVTPKEAYDVINRHPSLNIAGPTGAGKGTLVTYLTQSNRYAPVVSDTTRYPRPHNNGSEVNGVNYWFIDETEAINRVSQVAYIEVKAVHEKTMYGTSRIAYEQVVKTGRTPILEIDVQGIEDLMKHVDTLEAVFLLPPSFDVWQTRLDGRGKMDQEDKRRRLLSAVSEIEVMLANDRFYPVINTDVITTGEIIISQSYKEAMYRKNSIAVAQALLKETEEYLSQNR